MHDQANFVLCAGSDTGVLRDALFEVIVAIPGVGNGVVSTLDLAGPRRLITLARSGPTRPRRLSNL